MNVQGLYWRKSKILYWTKVHGRYEKSGTPELKLRAIDILLRKVKIVRGILAAFAGSDPVY